MKSKLTYIRALAAVVAVGAIINSGSLTTANAQGRPADAAWTTIVIDVACDADTMRMVGAGVDGPLRGTTFIVNGKIYPANTIPMGNGFDIDTPGDIGSWSCRGTFHFDRSEFLTGKQPHQATIQQYHFGAPGDFLAPDSLRSEGMEGVSSAPFTSRVVYGGTGEYRGVIGEVKQETLGRNSTGLFNFRFTFKVRRGA
jgi:hypothetical protein